jgi:oleandomycin transport system ATP-binding protein
VSDVLTLLRELTHTEPELSNRGELTARVDDDSLLPELVRRVSAAGIHVHELSLHLPSLDEVFMTLTGRVTDTEEDAA